MMEALLRNLGPVMVVVVVVVVVVVAAAAAAASEAGFPEGEVVTAIANPLMEKLDRSSRLDSPMSEPMNGACREFWITAKRSD